MTPHPRTGPLSRLIPLYIIANFGAFTAFIPLLTLILPQIVEQAGVQNKIITLSWLLVAGATTASIANIIAGHVSDILFIRHGYRRTMITGALIGLIASYVLFFIADSIALLFLAIILFQLALNFFFSPLTALLTDYVPDGKKGWVAGWLGLSLPFSTFFVTVIARIFGNDVPSQLILVTLSILFLCAPLLLFWPFPKKYIETGLNGGTDAPDEKDVRTDFHLAWISRFLVQFSGATMVAYLYFYVQDFVTYSHPSKGQDTAQAVGTLAAVATITSIIVTVTAGRLSDRVGRRKPFLSVAAAMVSCAMLMLLNFHGWPVVLFAYGLFSAGLTTFLTIDSAMIAQMLSGNEKRATFLGIMNLTNTIPAILSPAATLIIAFFGRNTDLILTLLSLSGAAAFTAAIVVSRIKTLA